MAKTEVFDCLKPLFSVLVEEKRKRGPRMMMVDGWYVMETWRYDDDASAAVAGESER